MLRFTVAIVIILTVWGCSTQKDRWANRAFHNTTARYNGYWNAKELLKEAQAQLNTSYKEDYTELLPIYIYGDEVTSKTIYPQMDTAIKKTSVVINRHAMPNPGYDDRKKVSESDVVKVKVKVDQDEYCRWIDDNWLLMGVSNFMKRDFELAQTQFKYVAKEYRYEEIKYDALLWLAKTHIEDGDYDKADKYIKILLDAEKEAEELEANKKQLKKIAREKARKKKKRSRGKKRKKGGKKKKKKDDEEEQPFPDRLKDDLNIVLADYFIHLEDYEKAIEHLEKGVELTKKKKFRTRLMFILAQLYAEQDNAQKANEYYTRVIKAHPEYEMEFYARLNRALNVNIRSKDYNDIKKELEAMLRDDKNIQYFDQIHYALGEIEWKERNETEAIDHYIASTETSVDNPRQKGVSFLKLGDIYFGKRDYPHAQQYYDSCSVFLPKEYEGYEQIYNKAQHLNELVKHISVVELEDSLQMVANLPKAERDALIDDIIQKLIEEEEAQRLLEEQQALNGATNNQQNTANNNASGANWYFYNQQARGLGFSEFKRNWGSRKLEDNWRRSNKNSTLSTFDNSGEDDPELAEGDSAGGTGPKGHEYYTKNLPLTAAMMSASHDQIIEALYSIGIIYKEKLQDNPQAIGTFEDLVSRYDTCKYQLAAYYQLYRLYLETGNDGKANEYKSKLSKFPESEYWKVIENPNYKQEAEKQRIADEQQYQDVYNKYKQRRYNEVLTNCNRIIADNADNFFIVEYYFLKALVAGRLQQMEAFKNGMQLVVDKYKGHELATEAQGYLDRMNNIQAANDEPEQEFPYTYNAPEQHYFILVFPKTQGQTITNLRSSISNFNSSYFGTANLNTSTSFIDVKNQVQVVLVKPFDNAKKAKDYYIAFKTNTSQLKNINTKFEFYTISQSNYPLLYQHKDLAQYKAFYEANYLKSAQ